MKKIETLEETLEKILTEHEVVSNNNVLFNIVTIIFIALFILLIVSYVYRSNENIIHTSLIMLAISVLNFIVCILFHFKIVVVAILFVSRLFLPSISYPMKNPELTIAIYILAILLVVFSFILMYIQYLEYMIDKINRQISKMETGL